MSAPLSDPVAAPPPRHSLLEDLQAMLVGCLFTALGVSFLREAQLLSGGTTGVAFLIHYLSGWRFGLTLFVINLPFYIFGLRALGWRFTLKTFCSIGLLAVYAEWLPSLIGLSHVTPLFAALMGGLLIGMGILILIRHGASLGGIGVLAIYLQKTRGWRAGSIQMGFDAAILSLGFLAVPPSQVLISVVGAAAVNLVIGVNHRSDRYLGF